MPSDHLDRRSEVARPAGTLSGRDCIPRSWRKKRRRQKVVELPGLYAADEGCHLGVGVGRPRAVGEARVGARGRRRRRAPPAPRSSRPGRGLFRHLATVDAPSVGLSCAETSPSSLCISPTPPRCRPTVCSCTCLCIRTCILRGARVVSLRRTRRFIVGCSVDRCSAARCRALPAPRPPCRWWWPQPRQPSSISCCSAAAVSSGVRISAHSESSEAA